MIKLVLLDIDGVITNGKIYINELGEEVKQVDFKDIDAVYNLKEKNYLIGMITGEDTRIVSWFKNKFKPDYFFSGKKDKLSIIEELELNAKISKEQICFVGDSKHDFESIKYVGLGVCPNDAIYEVREVADIVLQAKGGYGCIHELIAILEQHNSINRNEFFDKIFNENIETIQSIKNNPIIQRNILNTCNIIVEAFKNKKKVLLCGNGGSAADAQHIATEFVSRFYMERDALDAEALTVNTSSLTAIGNDYNFEKIFSRQIEAKGKEGDVLIGITTSGKSKNIINAFKTAKKLGMKCIAFTGNDINEEICSCTDFIINIPTKNTPRIQEAHILIGHAICQYVEKFFFEYN